MTVSRSSSSSSFSCLTRAAKSTGADTNIPHLADKLDSLARFYQRQLDWVDKAVGVEFSIVEAESDDEQLSETEAPRLRPAAKPITPAALRRMHWRRQMRSLESKLNGKGHKHRPKSAPRQPSSSNSSRAKANEEIASHQILDMFSQIIGARMESCRRVQKLVAINSRFEDKRNGARSPDQPAVKAIGDCSMNDITP